MGELIYGLRENVIQTTQVYLWKPERFVYLTLKMAAIRNIETSGTTLPTTRRHMPEDWILRQYHCEQLKSRASESSLTVVVERRPHGEVCQLLVC
jgi:hypothetical protein